MRDSGRNHGHEYGEAFMLMKYASQDGLIVEYIWNSRDGVTPFGIIDRSGKVSLYHADWHLDEYRPNHQPQVGDRIFINLTLEKAKEYRRKYVERWWDGAPADAANGKLAVPAMSKYSDLWTTKEGAVEYLAEKDYVSFGEGTTPDVLIVTQEWLDTR